MSLINIKEVSKTYLLGENEINALSSVDLKVEKGEFLAIIGTSGSGKSTLMNILGCLDGVESGEYLLEGKDISKLRDKDLSKIRREKIGFIFQSFNLIPTLTAYENVELPLVYKRLSKKVRHKKTLLALEKVGLSDRNHHKPSEMSGGQQQRVAIARAIANDPEIILADEPTGNLDSKTGVEITNLLLNLNEQGITIILITHDNKISTLASRIVKIHDGKILD